MAGWVAVGGSGAGHQELRKLDAAFRAIEAGTGVISAVRRLPAREADYAARTPALDPRLLAALSERGIDRFYSHQAEAIAHALEGLNVVIVTPTASGKTLCYNAPVLESVLRDGASRALYLFPTKALAQDQLAELHELATLVGERAGRPIAVSTFDGDTPQDARRSVRARAHVVLSNPDMLHSGILPHHPRWAKLFENLRFVVIDELHAYRGVFGSHLTNILRRLRRVCRHYGAQPTFICSSATIANPRDLAERLTEEPFELVDRNGAPQGEKLFVFLNPPLVNAELGIRRSYLGEARRVATEFLKRHLQTIVFAQSRLATEILTTYLKEAFPAPSGGEEPVRGYRGGYLPNRRRAVEQELREGRILGVVSTNALELGIDIGALDACVMAGYPGTIAATWQRAGRAGRRLDPSAAVLVASSTPIDQFVIRNPDYFFDASPEHALINPDNLHILVDHVKCAAFELPFTEGEQFGRDRVDDVLRVLAEEGFVHFTEGRWHWTHESYPADAVSLRSVSSDNFVVVDQTDGTAVIAEVDYTGAPATLHEKAIYIVEGQLFQVERTDFVGRKAYVRAVDCDYYTDAITYTKVTVLDVFEAEVQGSGLKVESSEHGVAAHGEVHVVSRVVGFKKIRFYTNETVGSGELDLPEQPMHTTACWLTIPREIMAALPYPSDRRREGVVGLATAMRHVAQLLLMCDRHDLGVSIDGAAPDVSGGAGSGGMPAAPRIFIYDAYPGGIGFSEPLFRMRADLVGRTRDLIAACPCEAGCPSCVGPVDAVGPCAKGVALAILDAVASVSIAPPPSVESARSEW